MDKLKIVIPGKPEYLTMVRLAIGSIATTAGFSLDDIEDIKTAVEEACKNVTCHGHEKRADEYEVECGVNTGRLEIAVKDICDCHTLEKVNKACRHCPGEGNIALYMMQTLMDEVTVENENGKKCIKMVKAL